MVPLMLFLLFTEVPKQAAIATLRQLRISERSRDRLRDRLAFSSEYLSADEFLEIFSSYDRRKSSDSQVGPNNYRG